MRLYHIEIFLNWRKPRALAPHEKVLNKKITVVHTLVMWIFNGSTSTPFYLQYMWIDHWIRLILTPCALYASFLLQGQIPLHKDLSKNSELQCMWQSEVALVYVNCVMRFYWRSRTWTTIPWSHMRKKSVILQGIPVLLVSWCPKILVE